jgi:hypothetical protein
MSALQPLGNEPFARCMRLVSVVASVVIVGCGSDDDQAVEVNTCVVAGASYLFESAERDPSRASACGPMADQVLVVPSTGELPLPDGCRITANESMGCRVQSALTCDQSGATTTVSTAVDWLPDGSGATGLQTFTISLANGSTCSSTYNIIATRL